jgi:hypothetical protein
MTRKLVTILVVGVACGVLPAVAAADTPVAMCVPSAANTAITTPNSNGTCSAGKTMKSLANEADLTAAKARITKLEGLLKGVTRGTVHDRPTLTFSGENVRIINGANSTSAVNGTGNLILGYNEAPGAQTGSHNIIVGLGDTATSYGSLIVGVNDSSAGPSETVLGFNNAADHQYANALGGQGNRVAADFATISGGAFNNANALYASVTGGGCNVAGHVPRQSEPLCANPDPSTFASVTGGTRNFALGAGGTVSGGEDGSADGGWSSVSGGSVGTAKGAWSSVSGGTLGFASGAQSSVSGGSNASAKGSYSSNLGGNNTRADFDLSTYPAGP